VKNLLLGFQVMVGLLLIAAVLLQNKGTGLSGIFGGSDTTYRTRRGAERGLFYFTILLTIAFISLGAVNFYRS
jgi:protein translocase SecG subunit